jgi:N-acetylmuramoyl-L-alanine amidase
LITPAPPVSDQRAAAEKTSTTAPRQQAKADSTSAKAKPAATEAKAVASAATVPAPEPAKTRGKSASAGQPVAAPETASPAAAPAADTTAREIEARAAKGSKKTASEKTAPTGSNSERTGTESAAVADPAPADKASSRTGTGNIIPSVTPKAAEDSPEAEPEEMGATPLPAKRGARTLTRALGLKLGRVVLDAGHGGHDVGTHGPSGYLEKDLALDITQRLGALIEEGLGSEVIYTRTTDTYVALEDRTRIANERKADLFLSIHANSSPYRTVAGVETYVLNFTTSRTALDLAARENASSTSSIYDLQELLNKIALKDKIDESSEFATRLQIALSSLSSKSNGSAKNRGVKRAPFVVLIGANMPSVLAEIGFLSNSNDEALLRKPDHRQRIAEALYKGIASYASTLSRFRVAQN